MIIDILIFLLIVFNIILTSMYLSKINNIEKFEDAVKQYKQTIKTEYNKFLAKK